MVKFLPIVPVGIMESTVLPYLYFSVYAMVITVCIVFFLNIYLKKLKYCVGQWGDRGGAALFGIPFLQVIYRMFLEAYQRNRYCLCWGVFFCIFTLYIMGITIIRGQRLVGYMYLLLRFLSAIVTFIVVNMSGMVGTVISYFLLMLMEVGTMLVFFYRKCNIYR